MSEFSFIRDLLKRLPRTDSEVVLGAGDDTAVIRLSEDSYLLATTDSQVDGVHFLSKYASAKDIGRKAIAVNVSDIAAMGGKPTYCLASLILPKSLDKAYVNSLNDGIIEECKKYGVQIVGGNISKGKGLVVDIFMLGKLEPSKLLKRGGARPGDKILVTGSLGGAAAGLQLLFNPKIKIDLEKYKRLLSKQFTPTARLGEAEIIVDKHLVSSMIDISDGLGQDIHHICESSKVGARIYEEKIPVTEAVEEVSEKLGKKTWELPLTGGEDYELCFTAPEVEVDKIISAVKNKTGTEVAVIGEILPKNEGEWMELKDGKRIKLPVRGWDHFE